MNKTQRREELRTGNLAAWKDGPSVSGKLDTSLKKHTALLTKLRTALSAASSPGLVRDIQGLSLEKYVDEVSSAVFEGLAKVKTGNDITGATEVISALHMRFPTEFTPKLVASLLAALKPTPLSVAAEREAREKEDAARTARQRSLLRVLAELEYLGVVRPGPGKSVGDVTWSVLRDLLTYDKEGLVAVAPVAIAFAKYASSDYLPASSAADMLATSGPGSTAPGGAIEGASHAPPNHANGTLDAVQACDTDTNGVIPSTVQERFRKLLLAFLDALTKRQMKVHVELQKQDKKNYEAYIKSGQVFEDREKTYEKDVKAWEKGWASVTQLSEILGVPAPILPTLASNTVASNVIATGAPSNSFSHEEAGSAGSPWADDEEKRFYHDLKNLSTEVPPSVLGTLMAGVRPGNEDIGSTEETSEVNAIVAEEVKSTTKLDGSLKIGKSIEILETEREGLGAASNESVSGRARESSNTNAGAGDTERLTENDENDDQSLSAGPASQLEAIFTRLADASSTDTIDNIAIDFAGINNKATRKRLAKHLVSVHKNRYHLIPFYARLIATLDPYMPDMTKDILSDVGDEFRYFERKRKGDGAVRSLRYIGELIKFGIAPVPLALHALQVLLDDFTDTNIENMCVLLETCGRYLLKSAESTERMQSILDTIKRKKMVMNLSERHVGMLDNAYYQCNPTDRPVMEMKQYTPIELFIKYVYYKLLDVRTLEKVSNVTLSFAWSDAFVYRKLHNVFCKIWKVKYGQTKLFAELLSRLKFYYPDFVVSVIDDVLETIRHGMETNSYQQSQQRLAVVKYVAELFEIGLLNSRMVFDCLWSFVTYGHANRLPSRDEISPLDLPDDYFRIRMVCTLLESVGSSLTRRKMDSFLLFFEAYILAKAQPLPMDITFIVADTFEKVRPKRVRYTDFEECLLALEKSDASSALSEKRENRAPPPQGAAEEDEQGRVNGSDGNASENGGGNVSENEIDTTSDNDDDDDDDDDDESDSSPSSDDSASDSEETSSADDDDDDDEDDEKSGSEQDLEDELFAREYAQMLTLSANDVRKVPDRRGALDIPVSLRKGGAVNTGASDATMSFSLLSKRNNKQHVTTLEIPKESSIVAHTLEKQAQNKAEQEHMKRIVLGYERNTEMEEEREWVESMNKRGINVKQRLSRG